MTPAQKQLVCESFPAVREMLEPLSLLFYGRLFELNPALRPMFRSDIAVQGRKLMDMLTAVIDNLDHLEDLAPAIRAMGQRHVGYGVQLEHYDAVKTALIWALGQALDTEFYPEIKTAWSSVIEAISTVMKEGAAEVPPISSPEVPREMIR